ncbi:disulfide bond formation protein B [Candidatus Parcubacteria bacterium]|nr:MAG: disulfide bond formation protein B [Candidatus Parcubacteria bacterium]
MVSAETLNYILALGTVATQLVTLALLLLFFFGKNTTAFRWVVTKVETWGMWKLLLLSFGGSLLTLYYSEILGYPPCPLCWWQRVFLYPQVALFAVAIWKREKLIVDYTIVLSGLGFLVALYHHALQVLPSGSLPCPAEGTVSCAQRFVFEFGYITFPLMAATLFAFFIAILLFVRARN